jgi:hypothetical protein
VSDRRGYPAALLKTAARLMARVANDLRTDGPTEDVDELERAVGTAQRVAEKIRDQNWKTHKRGRTKE